MKKLDSPCSTCGWLYTGFHICVAKGRETPLPIQRPAQREYSHDLPANYEEFRTGRQIRHDQDNAVRDRHIPDIVEDYNTGTISIKDIAKKYGSSFQRVSRILHAAEKRGETTVRSRGQTIQKGA